MSKPEAHLIVPPWPAPANIKTLITTRHGGVSTAPYDSLNLGMHVGDDLSAVAENRRRLQLHLPHAPAWLRQVHGTHVLRAESIANSGLLEEVGADASHTSATGLPCAVMIADCLPVLFCDQAGTQVAAAHAGWRGLCAGVIENTVTAMAADPQSLMAYLGPAIGPEKFEVGSEVRDAFIAVDARAASAFKPRPANGKFLADIYMLARQRLARAGVEQVYGGDFCTVTETARFYSYRREGKTGRMAALIWRE
jgi:polyphenol oxidase